MERPPIGSEGAAATAQWIAGLAAKWADATVPPPTGTTSTDPSAAPALPQIFQNQRLELPSALVDLYASMSSNGISFIGRYEAPSVGAIDKLFPSFGINACGAHPVDYFTVPNPYAVRAAAAAASIAASTTAEGVADGSAAKPATAPTPTPPPAAASSSFTPVCMCHFNSIHRITPLRVKMDLTTGEGGTQASAYPNPSGGSSPNNQQQRGGAGPISPQSLRDATPLDVSDRFFVLWAGSEGAAPAHSNCTGGDGTGVDILLRYNKYQPSRGEPEVWGYVPPPPSVVGGNSSGGSKSLGTLFYISKTFVDFVRIGCLRFCWARLWPLLLAPRAPREAFGLADEWVEGAGGGSEALSTMRPWLEVFTGAPLRVTSAGIVPNSVRALVR